MEEQQRHTGRALHHFQDAHGAYQPRLDAAAAFDVKPDLGRRLNGGGAATLPMRRRAASAVAARLKA